MSRSVDEVIASLNTLDTYPLPFTQDDRRIGRRWRHLLIWAQGCRCQERLRRREPCGLCLDHFARAVWRKAYAMGGLR